MYAQNDSDDQATCCLSPMKYLCAFVSSQPLAASTG